MTIADLAAQGSQGAVPVCGLSQTGFLLSVVDTSTDATFSDFMDCRHDQLFIAAMQAMEESSQTTMASLDMALVADNRTADMDCVQSQVVYADRVGAAAMWSNSTCGRETGLHSLGEAYRTVHPSLFVTQGAAKPLLELPGLLRAYLQTIDPEEDVASQSHLFLDEINLREKDFVSHVRGEDWVCSCSAAGVEVSCVQMYRLMECPRQSSESGTLDLERDCCILPNEPVSCKDSDPISCSNAILEYISSRDQKLASRNTQIALHPQAAFEGYRLPFLLGENTTSSDEPFIAGFQLSECARNDMTNDEQVFVAEESDDTVSGLGEPEDGNDASTSVAENVVEYPFSSASRSSGLVILAMVSALVGLLALW